MDRNEFFRQATLLICGNLAFEQAPHETLLHIRRHIPVDLLFAEYLDPGLGVARTLVRADRDGGVPLDVLTPVPPEARDGRAFKAGPPLNRAAVMNRPDENGFPTAMLRYHGLDETATSLVALKLVEEDGMAGGLVAIALRRDAFDDEHAALLSLLSDPFRVAVVSAIQHRDLALLEDRLADDDRYLYRELLRLSGDEIVGADFGLKPVMTMVRQVAPLDTPVLIAGETGVGKDVVANAIHLASERRDGPFVAVNCGAIPDTLLDSELFGHEKGAFSGALSRKRGRFERAHEGTIFLVETGEMPLNVQVRLLRVLQHREVERIGGTDRIPVDIRVVAATNQELPTLVREGRFREDLWFRLNVFPIEIPPLRERRGDVPALVRHFLERKVKSLKRAAVPDLAVGAMDALMAYDWPGNVRELENLVERAMILCGDGPLRFDTLAPAPPSATAPPVGDPVWNLDAAMAQHIRRALEETDGRIHGADGAGALLGMNPNTLRSRMRKLAIPFGTGSPSSSTGPSGPRSTG